MNPEEGFVPLQDAVALLHELAEFASEFQNMAGYRAWNLMAGESRAEWCLRQEREEIAFAA